MKILGIKRLFSTTRFKRKKIVTIDCEPSVPIAVIINSGSSTRKPELYRIYLGMNGTYPMHEVLEKAKKYFDKEKVECFSLRLANEEEKAKK